MKKFLKVIGIIILIIIAFVLIAGIILPKNFHIERSTVINGSKDSVWSNVSSLQSIAKWSPWTDGDPNLQVTYEGQEGAIGSVYNWKGNKQVGSGNQTITKIDKPNRIDMHINFIEPFAGQAEAFITLNGEGNSTKTTWGLDTKYPYPMNVMTLFINLDKVIGEQYEKGLSRLKKLSEH